MPSSYVVTENRPQSGPLRQKVFDIIFGHHTAAGLGFDIALLIAILASVTLASVETLPQVREGNRYGGWLLAAEIIFTVFFAVEYLTRVWCVEKPTKYIFSFFGVVDLLAVLPSIVAFSWLMTGENSATDIVNGAGSYAVIRSLRLLRIFRLLRIGRLERESSELASAIWKARTKVVVFLGTVLIVVIIAGTLMYEIEQTANKSQIHSIPEGIYWAIVTMTTVGYGDIVPKTFAGKIVSSLLILIGYSLIIVPTGFVSAEVVASRAKFGRNRLCPACQHRGHDSDAKFCKICGAQMTQDSTSAPKKRIT